MQLKPATTRLLKLLSHHNWTKVALLCLEINHKQMLVITHMCPDDVKQVSVTRHNKTMESDSYSGDDTKDIVNTDLDNDQVTSNTDDNNDEIKPIDYIIDTCLNKQLPVFSWDNYPYFPGAFNSTLMDFCITVPSQEVFVSENRVSKKITFSWAETLVGRTHHKGNCWYKRLCFGVYVCTGFNTGGTSCLFKETPTWAKKKHGRDVNPPKKSCPEHGGVLVLVSCSAITRMSYEWKEGYCRVTVESPHDDHPYPVHNLRRVPPAEQARVEQIIKRCPQAKPIQLIMGNQSRESIAINELAFRNRNIVQ
jgi:hypothetical protein